jgi:hypothetical protein
VSPAPAARDLNNLDPARIPDIAAGEDCNHEHLVTPVAQARFWKSGFEVR